MEDGPCDGALESTGAGGGDEDEDLLWLVWKFEGSQTLAGLMEAGYGSI